MGKNFKEQAEKWAEEKLKESDIKEDCDKRFKEFLLLGSLIYKEESDGSLTWIPRL